jgi:hypothetical protein
VSVQGVAGLVRNARRAGPDVSCDDEFLEIRCSERERKGIRSKGREKERVEFEPAGKEKGARRRDRMKE